MSLGSFIAGPYTSAFNSSSLGLMQDGFEVSIRPEEELVNQSDIYGDSVIDSVYRGGNCMLSMIGLEFSTLFTKSAPWPFGDLNTSSLPAFGFMGIVGRMAMGSSLTAALVLTSVNTTTLGTTPLASPATMTASAAKVAEGTDLRYLMTSRLRTLPLTMRLFPYEATNPTGMAAGTYDIWFLNA